MISAFSENLDRVLNLKEHAFSREIQFRALAAELVSMLRGDFPKIDSCLQPVDRCLPLPAILRHLSRIAEIDNAVRDCQTVGHLAKLLTRFDVFEKRSSYEVIALPHILFDEVSRTERYKILSFGTVITNPEVMEKPEVLKMLEREENWCKKG